MTHTVENFPRFLRSDPLTGVGNALAFFEWLLIHSEQTLVPPFTLISLDIKDLKNLNDFHGHATGDAALRWAALVLLEEAEAEVYRIGGDEFVGVLVSGSSESHKKLVDRVCDRLRAEATLVKLEPPAASVAVIHYTGFEKTSPKDVLGVIYGAFIDIKNDPNFSNKVFDAASTEPARDLSGLINDFVRRMVSLGSLLDQSHQLAYTDSITGLPNMQAAMLELESAIDRAASKKMPFALLLIDGDDLSRYNKVGYLVGDEMINQLGATLGAEMRPGDFLARWRTGDEFIVVLQDASTVQALALAERLRKSVAQISQGWLYPITISIGVAGYPEQGVDASELLRRSEQALYKAKRLGKNRVTTDD